MGILKGVWVSRVPNDKYFLKNIALIVVLNEILKSNAGFTITSAVMMLNEHSHAFYNCNKQGRWNAC